MGKSMTKDQRKNSKFISRDQSRKKKYSDMMDTESIPVKTYKPKKKWKPHSEIEAD